MLGYPVTVPALVLQAAAAATFSRYAFAAAHLKERRLVARQGEERCPCEWCKTFRYRRAHLLPHTDVYYADPSQLVRELGAGK